MAQTYLELIDLITAGYSRRNIIPAIHSCITSTDMPINVVAPGFAGQIANPAFLDLLRITQYEFQTRHISNNFAPEDRQSGAVDFWLAKGNEMMHRGGGRLGIRVWDGHDLHYAYTANLVIRGFIVSCLELVNPWRGVPSGQSWASHPFSDIAHTGLRPALRLV